VDLKWRVIKWVIIVSETLSRRLISQLNIVLKSAATGIAQLDMVGFIFPPAQLSTHRKYRESGYRVAKAPKYA
jgi:hypothetical protein